ncbi:MAG: protein kinase [Acidobacteriota bacterium]
MEPDTLLNNYRIAELLGAGGMGEVYLAEDTTLDRRIAIKVLPSKMAADPERRQRFEREAKAVAALNHPNIVTIFSVEESEGKAVDHRSDIFSLGILLYEMATGERPFKGDNKISVLSSLIKETPVSVTELNRSLPRHLGRIIKHCLEKDPEQRLQSAQDLRNELLGLRDEMHSGELEAPDLADAGVAAGAGRMGRKLLVPAIVAVAAAAVALGYLALRPAGERGVGAGPVASSGAAAGARTSTVAPQRPSVAVLYFDNLSGDPSLDWLRSGLPDMMVTDLSQSPGIRVLGTDRLYQILNEMDLLEQPVTSFEVVQAVAERAGVDTVLLGSFAKAGETIRISARLQQASDGEILSSERVEGQGESGIFSLVDDLTGRIRDRFELAEAADPALDREIEKVTTSSLEAYRFYAEGIKLHDQDKEAEAIPLYQKAVEADPDFAMAYAKLSISHGNLNHPEEALEYARKALERAERLTARERYYVEGRLLLAAARDPRPSHRSLREGGGAVSRPRGGTQQPGPLVRTFRALR